jgi:protein phosphatase
VTLLRSGSATDTGLVRSVNQDLAMESPNLFAVADGMGGHAGGEVAARMAIDTVTSAFGRHPTGAGLAEAVVEANNVVWQHSLDNPELRGMGTTVTAVGLVNEEGGDVLALVNVGDSRSYRFHDGELTQLTVDHSLAEEMVRSGELTSAEAKMHPHRHILTRALGVSADVNIDLWRIRPVRGDRFLLCSDGLTNELDTSQISEVLSSIGDPQEAAALLVQAARTHGGSDNITAVVVDVVVGEPDSDNGRSAATVAAVGADFVSLLEPLDGQVGITAGGGTADDVPYPGSVPEDAGPNRRERRRARRRERRMARGRRLITVRTLIFVILLVGLVVGAFAAIRWYDTNSYFVRTDGNELVIYQGRIGGVLWYHPKAIDRTGVTIADVPSSYVATLRSGVEETSPANARAYVKNLKAYKRSETTPSTTPTTRPRRTTKAPTSKVSTTNEPTTVAGGF